MTVKLSGLEERDHSPHLPLEKQVHYTPKVKNNPSLRIELLLLLCLDVTWLVLIVDWLCMFLLGSLGCFGRLVAAVVFLALERIVVGWLYFCVVLSYHATIVGCFILVYHFASYINIIKRGTPFFFISLDVFCR